MMKRMLLSTFMLLTSCTVGPNYTRPSTPVPESYLSKSMEKKTTVTQATLDKAQRFNKKEDIPAQWWRLFHSKPLNDLITTSLQQNPNVAMAQAALNGALENVYAQRGAFYPTVGLAFAPSAQQTAKILTSVLASNQYNYSLYTGQVYVSYLPDVFGGTRRQVESLVAQAERQRFQLEATYLTLTANVVNAAIQEAALREQILATKKIIASQIKLLTMFKQQLNIGNVALTDIAAQKAALAVSEASLPPLEKQLAIQRDLLNALTGRFPDDEHTPQFKLSSLQLPGDLPISLPSTLLEHRPDIRAAEEQMHAANALIGVATANRLPNLTIGFTNAGTAATTLSTLFAPQTKFWELAGIITQPVFDGGTLMHRQRFAQANYNQAAAQYRLTVINAFQNVTDTLKAVQWDAAALRAARQAERATLKTMTISQRQFALGDGSKLSILLNEQVYLQAQLNLIQAEALRLSDTTALFQALGGGWWNRQPSE